MTGLHLIAAALVALCTRALLHRIHAANRAARLQRWQPTPRPNHRSHTA